MKTLETVSAVLASAQTCLMDTLPARTHQRPLLSRNITLILAPLLAALCWIAPAQEPAEPGFDHEHKQWTSVLAAVVHDDRVDYEALAKDHSALDQYLAKLTTTDRQDFAQWTKAQQLAFWINAYNAFTLQTVLMNYPLVDVDSLRDVGGKASGKVWKRKSLHLGQLIAASSNAEISLDDVLELALRQQFKDARVHAALCKGCLGSPTLRSSAFTSAALDKELDAAARAWLADSRRTKFDREQRRVEAADLFDTYREDFVREQGSVEAWIARYAPLDQRVWLAEPAGFERHALAFDWKLNDLERGEAK